MENKHDARPFVDLQKDAEEFQAKFEEDIEKCKSILDAKITALICDPDSLGNSVGPKQNALVEFSKAKYDIYISMKSLMNDMEKEWLKYISEMKKLFIDNVEVFLANTKLEVKLPSSGSLLSSSPKKLLGSKSAAVAGSIINSITKSFPGFAQKNKPVDLQMERNEVEMVLSAEHEISEDEDIDRGKSSSRYDNAKHQKKSSPAVKQNSLHASLITMDLAESNEEIHEPEQYVPEPSSRYGRKGRFTNAKKANGISAKGVSSSESQGEASEYESELTLANSRKSNRSSSRSKSTAISKEITNLSDESEKSMETETTKNISSRNGSLKTRKRNQASKNQSNVKVLEEKIVTEAEYEKDRTISKEITNPSDESEENMETETTKNSNRNKSLKTRRRNQASKGQSVTKILEEKIVTEAECEEDLTAVSIISEAAKNITGKTSRPRGRPARRKTMHETAIEREMPVLPNTVTSNAEHDMTDAFNVETSVARPSKSVTRRKTLLPNAKEVLSGADIIPGYRDSSRSKRKTIIGVSDLDSVAPSKRLKSSNIQKINITESEEAVTEDNLLENSDSYSEWISLKNIDGKITASPGIYEVKVWRAKKTAYIGCCDSLRQKLTLHKLKHNSGHKHLDKFIDRNYDDIQIRYEIAPTVNDAKNEVKNRVNSFVALHKTTPAYN